MWPVMFSITLVLWSKIRIVYLGMPKFINWGNKMEQSFTNSNLHNIMVFGMVTKKYNTNVDVKRNAICNHSNVKGMCFIETLPKRFFEIIVLVEVLRAILTILYLRRASMKVNTMYKKNSILMFAFSHRQHWWFHRPHHFTCSSLIHIRCLCHMLIYR